MATLTLCSMLLILSLFSLLLICLVSSLKKKYHHNMSIATNSFSLPPGPKPWPVFGCLFEMVINRPTYKWIHKIMDEMKTDISCIRLGHVHVITVTSPELAREFLKKQDSIFSSRPPSVVADIASNGYLSIILSPYGDQWKKMKRVLVSNLLSPANNKNGSVSSKIYEEADHLVYYVFNQCRNLETGGIVNVRTTARHYCAKVMKRMIFNKRFFRNGMDDGGPGAEEEDHVDALFVILAYIHSFCISDFLPWIRILDLDGHKKIVSEALKIVRKYHDREIDERVLMWKKGLKNEQVGDLLDVLLTLKEDNGRPMLSVEEIKALIIDLMFATVDNPSNAVEWALAEMINQPEMLESARQELDTIVGVERLVEEQDIPKLNYIKACIKEALRLHPIAPFNVPHASIEDTTVCGYFIPKGSHVLLSRLAIGRNPRVWDEPLKFNPNRHLKNEKNSQVNVVLHDPQLNLFSFGTGRRGCPGVDIGSTMSTLMMARLLQGFTWTMPPGTSKIELIESNNDLFLEKPLLAYAKPRLANKLYPKF